MTEFVVAILNLYADLLPQLHTPLGLRCLEQSVVELAVKENS